MATHFRYEDSQSANMPAGPKTRKEREAERKKELKKLRRTKQAPPAPVMLQRKSKRQLSREQYQRQQEAEKIGQDIKATRLQKEQKKQQARAEAAAAAVTVDACSATPTTPTDELASVYCELGFQAPSQQLFYSNTDSSKGTERMNPESKGKIVKAEIQNLSQSVDIGASDGDTTTTTTTAVRRSAPSFPSKTEKLTAPSRDKTDKEDTPGGGQEVQFRRQTSRKAVSRERSAVACSRMSQFDTPSKDMKDDVAVDHNVLLADQSPATSILEVVVRRVRSYGIPQMAAAVDATDSPYLNFRKEVIERGKVVCWICFVKDGKVVSEQDPNTERCPIHVGNWWNPMLVWPRKGSDKKWISVRPRHANSSRTGPFTLCNRHHDCQGPVHCQKPHSNTERDAWMLDRDGVIWKTRPPPRRYHLQLCRNYIRMKSKCPYESSCLYAHGQQELLEWKEFAQQQEQQVTLEQSWKRKVCNELISKLKTGVPSSDVVTEQRVGVEISGLLEFIDESESQPYTSQFDIRITNEMDSRFKRAALLRGDSAFRFVVKPNPHMHVCVSDDGTELISKNPLKKTELLDIFVTFETNHSGSFLCDVLFDLGGLPYLVKTIRVEIANSHTLAALKRLTRSHGQHDGHWDVDEKCLVMSRDNRLSADEAPYPIPDSASLGADINRLSIVGGGAELTKDNYKPLFHTLLFLEELHQHMFLQKFSARNVTMVTDRDRQIAGLWSVTLDRIVTPRTAQTALIRPCDSKKTYVVPVTSLHMDCVEVDVAANVDLAKRLSQSESLQLTVDFQFCRDGTHYSQLHHSIANLPEKVIVTHLLGIEDRDSGASTRISDVSSKLLDVDLSSNSKQKKAVNMILSHLSHLPIIVNGPFGTGKTRLLAEAIRLMTLSGKDVKVLVCTQSNHAADLYVQSFHLSIENERMKACVMRLCYPFRKVGTVPEVVRNYCDYMEIASQFVMPSYEEFTECPSSLVVVTTLITSGQLREVGLPSGFFTHVVIDEAAQATEPETVTPLALAGPNTVIVLAGDCRQISPLVRSPWARSGKLQRSLFRRLYNSLPGQLKVNLITNYRCNYDILRLTTSLFYNLEDLSPDHCQSPVQDVHSKYFSYSFYAVTNGHAEQGGSDGSYWNRQEASIVADQVQTILDKWPAGWNQPAATEVCIVTSEYRQVQLIRQLLRSRGGLFSHVNVLTSRAIQGREYVAVVVSTVMTRQENAEEYEREPNFLSDSKMLNTAMTRAKSLLLVVGDPDCLVCCKIGQKWERYLKECYKAGPNSLIGDLNQSEAIKKIVVDSSSLNVEAEEFFSSASGLPTKPISDLPPGRMVEASKLDSRVELGSNDETKTLSSISYRRSESICDLPLARMVEESEIYCCVQSSDDDESKSLSHNSDSWECTEEDSSDPDMTACLESEEDYYLSDIDHVCNSGTEQGNETRKKRNKKAVYRHYFPQHELLGLLQESPDRFVRCLLKVTANGEDAYGVVSDAKETDIFIEGRVRRNRAFDGEEVLVELLRKTDEDQYNSDKCVRRGQVVEIFSRKRPSEFVCQLYENTTHMLIPLDRGHPIFFNKKPEKQHAACRGCVVMYDYSRNLRGRIDNIKEKGCVRLPKAIEKLFIIQHLSWSEYNRYPMGIVSGVCDYGTTYQSGERVLSVQFSVPKPPVISKNTDETLTLNSRRRGRVITEAFTIDPEHSEDLDDALSVKRCDPDHDVYEVGVFIADVSEFVSSDSSLDKYARDIGMTVYDERGRQRCPMLPKHLSNDACSLLPGKQRPVLAVFQKYNSGTGRAVDAARFERRFVQSCCKLSYTHAEMIIEDKIPSMNCSEETRADVIRQVKILYKLSRTLRQDRLSTAMHYQDVDRTKDTKAHNLVEEFMIRTNRTVAETLCGVCPYTTPLVCQWEPKQQMLEALLKMCGNLITTSSHLPFLIRECGVSSYQMFVGHTVCPLLHVTKNTLKLIREALSSNRFQDVVAAVCTEGFHPQLALANSKFIRSQQRAIYVCSSGNASDEPALKHWRLACLYTHFTSPIRRYIDLVCHRLVRKHVIGDSSETCQYDEETVREICFHATFRRANMRQYQRELELLQFSCQIYNHPVATVAVIEEISGSYIDLFVPFCPHMPRRNSRLRLSALSASRCSRNSVGNTICSADVSWCIGMLPADEKRQMELPEDQYCLVKSELWKRLVSLITTAGKTDKQRYDGCQEIMRTLLAESDPSEDSLAYASSISLPRDATSTREVVVVTSSNSVETETTAGEANDSDERDESDWHTTVQERGRGKKAKIQDSRQQTASTLKQQIGQHGQKLTAQKQLRLFDLVSIQLSSKPMRGLLRPIVQLINFPNGISVCLEHNSYPSDCFADVQSAPGVLLASKRSYRNLDDYRKAWMPLVDVESATGSIRSSSTGMSVLIHNFQVAWTKRGNKVVGSTNLNVDYVLENQIACKDRDYVCLRYFDIPISGHCEDVYGEGATVELLRQRSCFNLVFHCQIKSSSSEETTDSTKFTFGRLKHVDDPTDFQNSKDKCEEIFVDLIPFHLDSFKRGALLSVTKKQCIAQMIHLGLPYRRMKNGLFFLEKNVSGNTVVEETICGTFRGVKTGKRQKVAGHEVPKPLDLFALLGDRKLLNDGQRTAITLALEQDVTLIQGPPGTGKTLTGVHIACWFGVNNKKVLASQRSLRQVMYCAPSNEATDLVTGYLMKVNVDMNIRILRIYGESIEKAAYPGPTVFKRYATAGLPLTLTEENKNLEKVSLHRRIRNPTHNSESSKITSMEEMFREMKDREETPSRMQVREYHDVVREAETREIMKAEVILCTCMQAGSPRLRKNACVYQCIVDEAGQCTEPETLVALARSSLEKIVLIGDHKQLRPVVLDKSVEEQLRISMFERLAKADRAFMLTEQYRMHKSICEFPSQMFYKQKLETPPEVMNRLQKGQSLWQRLPCRALQPKCFIHLEGREGVNPVAEKGKGGEESKFNETEVKAIETLVNVMVSRRHRIPQKSIRILTPYTAQKKAIEKALQKSNKDDVQVSSISASQGGEADFVILSTVRSLPRHEIVNDPTRTWIGDHMGFVTDEHQMNVGLTRARHGLFIVGNRHLLCVVKMWRKLIRHYERDGCVVTNPDADAIETLF